MPSLTRKNNIQRMSVPVGTLLGLAAGVMTFVLDERHLSQHGRTVNVDDLSIGLLHVVLVNATVGLLFGSGVCNAAAEAYSFFSGRSNRRWLSDDEVPLPPSMILKLNPV